MCATNITAGTEHSHEESMDLLSAILERTNMQKAYDRVLKNNGAPGVDGMTVKELKPYLKQHWPKHKESILAGRYQPQPVRKMAIPKTDGGVRQLGIPTVLDRLIQQAMHQVLSEIFDPTFSEHSFGYRRGRHAGQAVQQARQFVEEGYRWVVDMDLEKFFDRVNHDILMSRLARKVQDKGVLKLVRAYLEAGILDNGLAVAASKGTPQGGPLSPLLSNVLLDDFDKELERRGHKFCRYADDSNIYIKSKRAGARVLNSLCVYLENRLKLKVNQGKSRVDRPWKRKFLGYTVCNRKHSVRLKVAPEAVKRFKESLKAVFSKARGWSIKHTVEVLNPKLRGWLNYFRYISVKGVLEALDGWIRRHLRKILWRQWKRSVTRAKKLMQLGLPEERASRSALNGRGAWWNAGASHMNQAVPKKRFDCLGLVSLMDRYHQLKYST